MKTNKKIFLVTIIVSLGALSIFAIYGMTMFYQDAGKDALASEPDTMTHENIIDLAGEEITMEDRLAKLYNELGNTVVSTIPVPWEKIYFLGEVAKEKTSWSSVFYFSEEDTDLYIVSRDIPDRYQVSGEIYEQLMNEISGTLLEIYDCFAENGQEPWEQLSMSIGKTGNFHIDYLYDVISGSDRGTMEREMIWAYETFGYMSSADD